MKCKKKSGKLVSVIPLEEKDISSYLDKLSDVVRHTLHISSQQTEKNYLINRLEAQKKGITCVYAIMQNKTNNLIGAIEIRPYSEFKGQLYVWLNEHYWGYGYFQEAMELIIQAYFQRVPDPFFTAHVDMCNIRSHKALKKAGFADKEVYDGPYGKQYVMIYRKR